MKCAGLLILAALFACAIEPARATDEHTYAKGEYAVIRDGLSPDKQKSLASHADGDGGWKNFHLWLMAEPAHRRLMALDDINARLDSGPNAYYAFWSKDSRRVAVTYRSDRHVVELNLFEIEGHRARPILGPACSRMSPVATLTRTTTCAAACLSSNGRARGGSCSGKTACS